MTGQMELTHWAHNFDELVPRSVPQTHRRLDKPEGLWVSVDGPDDWPSWNEAEGFLDMSKAHPWRVELTINHGLLVIDRLRLLAEFTVKYGLPEKGLPGNYAIDWKRVAKTYNGIIIAPYQWPARLDRNTQFYYGWDCASGCIWDTRAIASVERLASADV